MDDYKATLEQWKNIEKWGNRGDSSTDACILELRARVKALEAQAGNNQGIFDSSTLPSVATDEELRDAWYCHGHHYQARRAIYNLGIEHGKASSRKVAEPAPVAGGLVKWVVDALITAPHEMGNRELEARAAILEVAKWLRKQGWAKPPYLLEREATRYAQFKKLTND